MKRILTGCLSALGVVFALLIALVLFSGGSGESGKESTTTDTSTQATEQQAEDSATTKEEAPAEPEPEPVSYQDVDINTLFDTLSNNPLNAKSTFEGTRVRFSGSLKNIDASGKYFSLGNGDEWSFDSIQCFIQNDDTLNRIASASMGDTITVCGTVTSVGEILGYSVDVDYIE